MFDRRVIWGLLGLLVITSWSAFAPGVPPNDKQPIKLATAEVVSAGSSYVGAMSCSASACHGSLSPDRAASLVNSDRIRRDEYIFWHDRDPHAKSLQTLQSDKSLAMLQRLQIVEPSTDGHWQVRKSAAEGYQNCLACHALQRKTVDNPRDLAALEAVSCESCHGPAKTWLAGHYEASWALLAEKPKAYIDTASPSALANSCVKCHVGAADREVNHDLIAAGHPVLKFELAAYRALLPQHWNDARLRAKHDSYEMALYAAGQKQASLAALDLLAARYDRSHATLPDPKASEHLSSVWPEFAEFDCFACHHDLGAGNRWSEERRSPRMLAEWSPWYFAKQARADNSEPIGKLQAAMQGSLTADDQQLPKLIAAARSRIAGEHERPQRYDAALAAESWDSATQAYLLMVAEDQDYRHRLARANGSLSNSDMAITTQLKELRELLAFVPGRDGPTRPSANAEEAKARRERVRTLLETLPVALQRRGAVP